VHSSSSQKAAQLTAVAGSLEQAKSMKQILNYQLSLNKDNWSLEKANSQILPSDGKSIQSFDHMLNKENKNSNTSVDGEHSSQANERKHKQPMTELKNSNLSKSK
jgi:hypothetical protein